MKDLWQFYINEWHRMQMQSNGCMPTVMYGFIIAAMIVCTMCSCKSVSSTEQTIDYRHMARLTERVDSLIHSTSTWQQSLYEKQTSLVDSFKQSEVRDTSRIIFLGSKGDTVKEVVTIYKERIIEHTTQESTQEYWEERFRQTDSLLQVAIEKQAETDSVLQSYHKETVVKEKPSVGDKLKWFAGGIVLSILGFIACYTAFIKKNN